MAHLTGFGLENFRVFGKETWFDFAPITIFTGTNSSGKSSVNKALLLLNESFKKYERFQQLSFATEKHQLNSFENTISNQNKDSDTISFLERYKLFNHKNIFNTENNESFAQLLPIAGDSDILPFADFIEIRKTYGRKDNQVEIREVQLNLLFDNQSIQLVSFNFNPLNVKISLHLLSHLFNRYLVDILEQFPEFENNYSNLFDKETINSIEELEKLEVSKQKMNEYFAVNKNIFLNNSNLFRFVDGLSFYNKDLDINEYQSKVLNELISRFISDVNIDDVYLEAGNEFDLVDLQQNINYRDLSVFLVDWLENCINTSISFDYGLVDNYISKIIDRPDILEALKIRPFYQILNPRMKEIISNVIKPELECVDNLLKFNTPLTFIEAVRANTQRVYTFQSQGTSVNTLLLEIWENGLSEKKILFLNKWVKEFGIGDAIEINNIKNVANEVLLVRGEQKIDIADVGYGFTQLLPMMLKCVHVAHFKDVNWCLVNGYKIDEINPTNSSLIIIEEPETNLHPALQSKVADFIVDFSKHFDATVIIETHSEYLIRRLQFLTAKKEIKPEDTIIHYLFDPNSEHTKNTGEQLRTIRIQKDGRLDKEFGTGFFDESTKLMMSILLGEKLN